MNAASRFLPALIIAVGASSLAASAALNPIVDSTVLYYRSQAHEPESKRYANHLRQPRAVNATKVVFAVGYRNSNEKYLRRVADVGSFAPGATVDHHFDLYNDVTFGGKTTTSCSAVSVTFANGNIWHM